MTAKPPRSLEPRLLRDGDEEALLELLIAAYERWPAVEISVAPIDHLRWKLHGGGASPPPHTVVEADGRLIAAELTFSQCFKARDKVLRAFDKVDACVHPDYRNRGVFRRMRAFTMSRLEPVMDLHLDMIRVPAIARITGAGLKRRPLANGIEALVRPLTFWSANGAPGDDARLRRIRARVLQAGAFVCLAALSIARRQPRRATAGEWSLTRPQRFDERIDALMADAAAGFDFIGLRRMTYLNWRYADKRAGDFRITLAEERGRVVGFSVLRLSHRRAYLADLLALPGRLDVAAALIDDAVERAREAGAAAIECWTPATHPYRTLLRDRGFFHARNASIFFEPIRVDDEAVAFLDDSAAAIHITIGDTDLV